MHKIKSKIQRKKNVENGNKIDLNTIINQKKKKNIFIVAFAKWRYLYSRNGDDLLVKNRLQELTT